VDTVWREPDTVTMLPSAGIQNLKGRAGQGQQSSETAA
jgi:hypothetical protein